MNKFSVELDLPEGVVKLSFDKKEDPRRVADITLDLLPFCDIVTDLGTSIAKQFKQSVSCKKGCGVCCCQMVPVSVPEAVIITEVIESLPADRKAAVEDALCKADKKLKESGLKEQMFKIYSTSTDKQVVIDTNRNYFDLHISCPFLVDGACSIYAWRPSRCREYSVLSPSDYCADPFTHPVKRLPVTLKFCESLSHAWASITNTSPIIIPLIAAKEWVEKNEEARELSIEGSESFIRAILNHACKRANREAEEKMKGIGV